MNRAYGTLALEDCSNRFENSGNDGQERREENE